ncbi:tripartite tricarboxylate transporter substrate binding protein [Aquincola sp. S2]|uniref:Tripartite tricarboxylate transporter substrate binding protein n=1 Tax=Pseudaquabacterium terrae TaxID=2732868 RepID=A0ABX2E973_9BURK|nr:tripartite tricarboxylate transporter substrate binding protein [Aquabacterium terrae]NRF65481.1 tripartite tricarboxylate transporter substrate binding protein [Aquabacterium terrae]
MAALAACAAPARAQADYPNRPIRLIVPFPAGGATDLIARATVDKLSQRLGQTVLVDNRAGAGGSIGSAEVARAAPDGYTLLLATSSTHAIGPELNPKLPYRADTDFTPILQLAQAPSLVLVPSTLPVSSMGELIAYAKARPGQLNYGSSGNGTIVHLMTEAFKAQAGVFVTHIPYRGTSFAINDLLAGQVHMVFESVVSGLPHVRDGKLKALAITSAAPSALVPGVRTVAESGLPGYEATTWFGLYGPKGLPPALVSRLNAELGAVLRMNEVRERLAGFGAEPVRAHTAADFAEFVARDRARWARIIKERRISVE